MVVDIGKVLRLAGVGMEEVLFRVGPVIGQWEQAKKIPEPSVSHAVDHPTTSDKKKLAHVINEDVHSFFISLSSASNAQIAVKTCSYCLSQFVNSSCLSASCAAFFMASARLLLL